MPISHGDDRMPAGVELGAFGKYQLIATLGQGGMANVFLALMGGPSGFNKLLVIKIMRQDLLAGSEETRRMFMTEARLAARLVHPNIVHSYEVGEHHGRYYLAMEYIDGQPLSTVLNRARGDQEIPLAEYLHMIAVLARGLHYAHNLRDYQGEPLAVVHRDVSPQNVIVTYDGQVKLLDFGIAKTADAEHMTQIGMIKGKLDYIAPEQLRNERVDGRADIFALGAMMWEVICGHRFAGGRKVTDISKIQARVTGSERRLRSLRPDVPASLERIVERAIALEPSRRYRNALELADAIELHIHEMGLRTSQRAVAERMNTLFAHERAEIHRLIDEQVQSLKHGVPEPQPSSAPRSRLSAYLSDHHLDDRSSIRQLAHALSTAPAPPSSLGGWLGLLSLALVAGAATMWVVIGHPKPTAMPAPLPAVAASEPTSAPPQRPVSAALTQKPTVISMSLNVDPPQARVLLDGIALEVPFLGAFTRDDANHRLEVSADGYRPLRQYVVFDQDRELDLRLERHGSRRSSDKPNEQPAEPAPPPPPRHERPNPYE